MKIKSIIAKKLLSHVKQPDSWFGLKYNMNLYRGCQHRCIYCDTRSECYRIPNFSEEILYKENAPELLRNELASKQIKGTIGLGSMNDPYMPIEKKLKLTEQALKIIAEFRFPLHIITKSDLILRDLELLKKISKVFLTISFTITTTDDELAQIIEPCAPLPSARLKAIKKLRENSIGCGVLMMPVLPYLEDDPQNIRQLVSKTADHGGEYILPAFGMTLRDRQRTYYYKKLDRHFPGLRHKYQKKLGNSYECNIDNLNQIKELFYSLCSEYDIKVRIPVYRHDNSEQLSFF